MDQIALVTGANRGLGFEFVRQLLHKNWRVIATARSKQDSHELLELVKKNPNECEFHEVDVTKQDTIQHLKGILESKTHLDCLINNAGTFGVLGASLEAPKEIYEEVFRVNVLGPLELSRLCFPLLQRAKMPIIANISSLMGSISDNQSGAYGPYRVSKAALNMLVKNIAVDYPKIISIVLHPGWVQTRMGGKEAPLKPHESVEGMLKVIAKLSKEDSGKFFDYTGRLLSW